MSVISWGKPTIEFGVSTGRVSAEAFTAFPEIKEDTAKLTTTAGAIKTATEEGGGVIDQYQQKNSYMLELEVFVKRGDDKPIEDADGVITDEYSVRLIPEDDTLKGFIMDAAMVHVEQTWSAADGETLKYTFTGLTPASGTIVKSYTKPIA